MFALILILVINGQSQAFALDHNLTQSDCAAELAANPALAETGALVCAIDTKGE